MASVLDEVKPDWIVTLERKGTALLRSYVEHTPSLSDHWPGWNRVLAQHALKDLPKGTFSGGVLVLDDAMHFGRQIGDLVETLVSSGVPRSSIFVAAFAVHRECVELRPEYWWYKDLSHQEFRDVRSDLIRLFQHRGSLLLDTEHVEVGIRATCSQQELFRAFSEIGACVFHTSCGGRTNLTIYRPRVLNRPVLEGALPSGTQLDQVVQKIRVVERGLGDYSIIPIFYPAVPCDVADEIRARLPSPLAGLVGDDDKNFHLVGVYAAMHLFRTAMAALRDLVHEDRVRVAITNGSASLEHLLALFPAIDVAAMGQVLGVEVEAGLTHRLLKSERVANQNRLLINASEGTLAFDRLDELHWTVLRVVHAEWQQLLSPAAGVPMTVLQEGLLRHLGHAPTLEEEALFSAALDRAIDDGDVGTREALVTSPDGTARMTRVFALDNEVVREDVARLVSVSGAEAPWRSDLATRP